MPVIHQADDTTAKNFVYILLYYFKHRNNRMLCKVEPW